MQSNGLSEEMLFEILRTIDKSGPSGKSIYLIDMALTAYLGKSCGPSMIRRQIMIFQEQSLITEVDGRFKSLTKLRRSLWKLPQNNFPHYKTTPAGKIMLLNHERGNTSVSIEKGLLGEYQVAAERIEKKLSDLASIISRLENNEEQIKDFYVRIIEIFGVFVAIFALVITGAQITFSGKVPEDAVSALIYTGAIMVPIAIVLGAFIILLERLIVRRRRTY